MAQHLTEEKHDKGSEDLSRIVLYSLLGGSTSLIPIPFLDDWVFRVVRRQMVWDLFRRNGLYLESRQARLLVRSPAISGSQGCLYKATVILILTPARLLGYIVQKVFKKILFVLAIKEASDRASKTFHEAYLLNHAAQRKRNSPVPDEKEILLLRQAVQETMLGLNTSPVRNIYRSIINLNRQLIAQAARVLKIAFRRLRSRSDREREAQATKVLLEEESLLKAVTAQTAEMVMGQTGYLEAVLERFEAVAKRHGVF